MHGHRKIHGQWPERNSSQQAQNCIEERKHHGNDYGQDDEEGSKKQLAEGELEETWCGERKLYCIDMEQEVCR